MSARTSDRRKCVAVNYLDALAGKLKDLGITSIIRPNAQPFPAAIVTDRWQTTMTVMCGAAHFWEWRDGDLRLIAALVDAPGDVARVISDELRKSRRP